MNQTQFRRAITRRQCRVRVARTWVWADISHGQAYALRDRLEGRITVDTDTDATHAWIAVADGAEEPGA